MFNEGLKEPGEFLGSFYRHMLQKEKKKKEERGRERETTPKRELHHKSFVYR